MGKTRQATDRSVLLENLSRFAFGGVAESDQVRTDDRLFCLKHLPIAEHRRVLDRDTLLVLGGRGAGKSQLFKVLQKLEDPSSLLPSGAEPNETGRFIAGYTAGGRTFPQDDVIANVLKGSPESVARNLWLGLLCGVLLGEDLVRSVIQQHLNPEIAKVLDEQLSSPSIWIPKISEHLESVRASLDRVDEVLTDQSQSLAITYDDLDILATKVADVYPLVRELLAFWLRNSRRWSSLRCKIFLRTDIFHADELAFTDSSKLRPLSVTLRWNANNLYRLVLKRLLNGDQGKQWGRFMNPKIKKDRFREDKTWGIIPQTDESDHRHFMEIIVGKWMGSNPRRGDSYQWFLNHLQDSRGDIAPRSFLKLFESTATRQVDVGGPPRAAHLLAPEQIAGALTEVSQDRINELKEEYVWIEEVGQKLKDQTVPMERNDFRKLIRRLNWDRFPEALRSKGDKPDRLIDYLISLGILRETTDKRIHVPDIYLFGFSLKRKGGIRRPRV